MIIDELFEGPQLCPECGGISFSDLILAEKKDACYYKVKASAKVWPSAYASGRLVQCRKKGAANYGKSKTEGVAESIDTEELANEVYAEFERIYPNLARRADERTVHAAIMDVLNYGGDSDPSALAQDVARAVKQEMQQGMAEGQLDEISQDTARSYAQKATQSKKDLTNQTYRKGADTDKLNKKIVNRQQGLNRAHTDKRYYKDEPGVAEQQELDEKWSQKYKSSINCANPRGFSQRAHCAGRKKNEDVAELDEGGDVFMPNIKDTAEYRAGLVTGKLPVPYPEGTQQYASYYKGVIDRASPTLAKVGEGEQQPGADYRDPPEADYGPEYQDMVARVKKLAGLGPMKTVYDPAKRVYKNVPTAVQPKK